MCVIRFAGDQGNHLTLTIHGRDDPESTDFWRGNLLRCAVEVSAGAFRGSMRTAIWGEDLARFLPEVEALAARRDDAAYFRSGDTSREDSNWVFVSVCADGGGRYEARGHICDVGERLNTLEFRWPVGAGSLPPLVEQVRAALAAFPVIGQRPP